MVRAFLPGAVAVCVVGLAAGAGAQDVAIERGRTIAETWCVTCHAIGDETQKSALADAPPFATLAGEDGFGVERVRKALLLPHPVMPEFPVTDGDIAALAAYIGSLAPASAPQQRTERLPMAPSGVTLAGGVDQAAAARGREIVMRDCSPCHRVEGLGESPVPDAPAFATLSERYPVSYLAEALAEGIMVSHEGIEMREFVFEPQDIDAIIAHLENVQAK